MAKKKDTSPPLTAQQLLEARVDAMMDPRPKNPKPPIWGDPAVKSRDKGVPVSAVGLPPLDIFETAKSAPEVPPEVLKTMEDKPMAMVTPTTELVRPKSSTPASGSSPAEDGSLSLAETDDLVGVEADIDDATSDAAIDDIVAQEGDEVLAAEDAGVAAAASVSPDLVPDSPAGPKHHPIFWFIVLLVAIVAIIAAYVLSTGK